MARTPQPAQSPKKRARPDKQIDDSLVDQSYLAFVRPTPRPFLRFVSGHFPAGTVTQAHSHPCIALHGCVQGPLVLVTDEGELPLDAGVFYLLAPGTRHYWRNSGTQTGATFGLLIDAEHPGRWPAVTGVQECCRKLATLVTGCHRFSVARDEALHDSYWLAADHLTSEQPREAITTFGALLTLIGHVTARLEGGSSHDSKPTDELAQQVRRVLLSRVNDRISIQEVARQLGVSPTRAKEAFREAFGSGIIAYHNQLKIWQAKRFLSDPSLTVEQVSRRLGFSTHSYFSRVFLQHTGESPTAYRDRHAS